MTYLRDKKSLRNSSEEVEQNIFDRHYLFDLELDSEIQSEPQIESRVDFENVIKFELSESEFQQRFCTKTVGFIALLYEEPNEAEKVILASMKGAFGAKMQMQSMDLFVDSYHHKAMKSSRLDNEFGNAYTQHVNQLYSLGREFDEDDFALGLERSGMDLRGIFEGYPNIPVNDMLPPEDIQSIILDRTNALRTQLFNLFDASNNPYSEPSREEVEASEDVEKMVLPVISKTFVEGLPRDITKSTLVKALGNLYVPFILYFYDQMQRKSDDDLLYLPANINPDQIMEHFMDRLIPHSSKTLEDADNIEESYETGYESDDSIDYDFSLDEIEETYYEEFHLKR